LVVPYLNSPAKPALPSVVSVAVPLFYNTDESRWRQAAYVNY
jgi:hypothetical protein